MTILRSRRLAAEAPSEPMLDAASVRRRVLVLVATAAGALVAALGALIVLGWATGMILVPSDVRVSPAVRLNTGVAFVLAGLGLGLAASGRQWALSRGLGAAVAVLAAATLSEYLFDLDLGIDQLVFNNHSTSVGPMAPNTATALLLCGIALASGRPRPRGWPVSELLALAGGLVGWLGVIGYAGGLSALMSVGGFLSIALPTALGVVALGLGIALVSPRGRLLALLAGDGAAGQLMRRLSAAVVLGPPLVALLLRLAREAGVLDHGSVILLLLGAMSVILLAIAYSFATSLEVADRRRTRAERQLRESEQSVRQLLEAAPDATLVVDDGGRIVMANLQAENLFGYARSELVGQSLELLVPERHRAQHPAHRRTFFEHPAARPMGPERELFARRKNGRELPVEISLNAVTTKSGTAVLAAIRDIAERKRAEELTRRLAAIVACTDDAILAIAPDMTITDWNGAAERLFGRTSAEAIGQPLQILSPPERTGEQELLVRRVLRGEAIEQHETERLARDGNRIAVSLTISPLRDGAGAVVGASAIARDISERKRFEGQLEYLADHDPLTGLFNRRRFETELNRELTRSTRYGNQVALLAIDLDHFKYVNDALGHAAGDELLARIGDTFRRRVRASDVLARIGGDEFAAMLPGASEADARVLAASLVEAVRSESTIELLGRTRQITSSIGIAIFEPGHEPTAEELIVEADIAMYDAKESGRNRVAVYSPEQTREQRMQARLTWAQRIKDALAHDRLALYAQPILSLNSETGSRHELLLRMLGDDGDVIPPGVFLYIAERMGLIEEIDRWVLHNGIALLAREQQAGHDVRLELNLSAKSISDPAISSLIAQELRAAGASAHGLCIEVTETIAIVNVDRAKHFATKLRELGCEFALDDFGTGFASFYYLKHLAFDYLKIDGEFIKDIAHSPTDQLVVRSLVDIARGLGKQTVAEYVGDEPTLELLRSFGVDYTQGFYIGVPVPEHQVDFSAPVRLPRPGAAATADAPSGRPPSPAG